MCFFRLKILIEDDCGATGFKLLAEITPVEDFRYPIPDDYQKDAETLTSNIFVLSIAAIFYCFFNIFPTGKF